MIVLAAKDVSKSHGASLIFEDVSFEVRHGDRVGIVGPNGSGKSTLCSLLLSHAAPDTGDLSRKRGITVGYLDQHNKFDGDHSVFEEGMRAFADVFEMEAELRTIENELATEMSESAMTRKLARLEELQQKFDQVGGYGIRAKVESVLIGLGLTKEHLDREVRILSGGESGRLALGKILLREPEVMILDEPTNHLDIAGCEWLESYLQRFAGACLIVSHDRYFLDRVTTRTFEVAGGTLTEYGCAYSEFEKRKAFEREEARKRYGEQRDYIRKEREFIKKHMGSQRTKEAKGRLRRLERLEMLEPPRAADQEIKLSINAKRRLGTEVVEFEDLSLGFDDRLLVQALDARIEPGDRLGIVGANGAGKSTLLKAMMGRLEPLAGAIRTGLTVEIGYFDQQHGDVNQELSPYEEIAGANLKLTDLQIRSFLARFLFTDEDVHRPLSSFSGGERSKLALAKIILQCPNVLVLDEPTNHLDIPSRKALELVLDDYDGVIITVSHDRFFLDRVCNRVLWLDSGQHELVIGNFSTANSKRRARSEAQRAELEAQEAESKRAKKRLAAKTKKTEKKSKPKQRSIDTIESEIIAAEEELAEIMKAMESPDVYLDPDALRDHQDQVEELRVRLAELESEWEEHAE